MKRFGLFVVLLLILGLGSYVRLAPIVAGDTLFQFDHGRDLWDVKKIVYDGDLTLIGPDTGLHGVFNGPYHYYLLALPIWLTNGHPLSGSYFNALLHILAIYACFELGRRMMRGIRINEEGTTRTQFEHSDIVFGLIAATIFAFARGAVSSTVFFWNPNWIPALMVPWVYGMWRGVIRKDGWGLVIAGFFGGIAANVEVAYGIFLFPTYVVIISVLWPSVWKRIWSWLGMVAYGVHFLPHLLFDIRNDFLMTRAILGLFSGQNVSLGVSIPLHDRFLTRAQELYRVTGGYLSADENYIWSAGLTIFLGIGLVWLWKCKKETRRAISFFLIPFVVYYICFLVYPRVAWPWYWVGLQTIFYFLCAFVLWHAYHAGLLLRFIALGAVGFWLVITLPYYFKEPTFLEQEPGRFSNMLRVVDSIFEDAKGKEFGVYTFTPPVRDHAFGYMLWWRGRTTYNYVPYTAYALRDGEAVPETVYLIIDPPCASYDNEESCKSKSAQLNSWLLQSTPIGQELWKRDYAGRLRVIKRDISR